LEKCIQTEIYIYLTTTT